MLCRPDVLIHPVIFLKINSLKVKKGDLMKNRKNRITMYLTDKEKEFLENKIQKKEMYLESVCKVPHLKLTIGMVAREFIWSQMEKEGLKWG